MEAQKNKEREFTFAELPISAIFRSVEERDYDGAAYMKIEIGHISVPYVAAINLVTGVSCLINDTLAVICLDGDVSQMVLEANLEEFEKYWH